MEQPKAPPLKILEVCKISPSPSPSTHFSLPLTYFDLLQFPQPLIDTIHFYSLPTHDEPQLDSVLQNLKNSLSYSLSHFLPLAGNLVWPNYDSPEPIILYKPGDSVSLTIAQTDADFNHLYANHVRKVNESHFLLPKLQTYETNAAPAMCLQITLFPNTGFSIGIIINHVVADGKTSTMFLKSWASICRNLCLPTLPPELTPDFDRTAAKHPTGIQTLYLKYFPFFFSDRKRFKLAPNLAVSDDIVKGTFELTRADIENLRAKAEEKTSSSSSTRHLSTFVLAFAHVSTCMIRAQQMEAKSKVALQFIVDWRPRLGTPVGIKYFGNGVSGYSLFMEAREFEEENAMGVISKKMSDGIGEIEEKVNKENGSVAEMLDLFSPQRWENQSPISRMIIAGWSPRFGIYDVDFGWGGCKKFEIYSIRTGETFSMADSRNGNGGVEVGIVLPSESMNVFCSLFSEGVKKKVNL